MGMALPSPASIGRLNHSKRARSMAVTGGHPGGRPDYEPIRRYLGDTPGVFRNHLISSGTSGLGQRSGTALSLLFRPRNARWSALSRVLALSLFARGTADPGAVICHRPQSRER